MNVTAPGYLRPTSKAPLLRFDYESETDSAALYKGGFLVRLGTLYGGDTCPVRLRDLPKVMVEHESFQGVFIINNRDLMGVGDGFYALCLGSTWGQPNEKWRYASMPGCGFTWKPRLHVGFIKTTPVRRDLPQLPWHLYVDDRGFTSFDYKRTVKLPDVVSTPPAPSLYKELIQTGADFVYMTSKGPKFMMIGDV